MRMERVTFFTKKSEDILLPGIDISCGNSIISAEKQEKDDVEDFA